MVGKWYSNVFCRSVLILSFDAKCKSGRPSVGHARHTGVISVSIVVCGRRTHCAPTQHGTIAHRSLGLHSICYILTVLQNGRHFSTKSQTSSVTWSCCRIPIDQYECYDDALVRDAPVLVAYTFLNATKRRRLNKPVKNLHTSGTIAHFVMQFSPALNSFAFLRPTHPSILTRVEWLRRGAECNRPNADSNQYLQLPLTPYIRPSSLHAYANCSACSTPICLHVVTCVLCKLNNRINTSCFWAQTSINQGQELHSPK